MSELFFKGNRKFIFAQLTEVWVYVYKLAARNVEFKATVSYIESQRLAQAISPQKQEQASKQAEKIMLFIHLIRLSRPLLYEFFSSFHGKATFLYHCQ